MGRSLQDKHKELLSEPKYKKAYIQLEDEFLVAKALIQARTSANLTQKQVAERMGTTQSVIARMESGKPLPSLRSVIRYAVAVNSRIELKLIQADKHKLPHAKAQRR
jgi:transcriptional regulator with XRE-family HTH domain